jgi:hypothetical protein
MERIKTLRARQQLQAELKGRRERAQAARREDRIARTQARVTPYTAEEKQSALEKLSRVAEFYGSDLFGSLRGFINGGTMDPTMLKAQLQQQFGVQISSGELGALMEYFDKDKDGVINCNEFLSRFFRTGEYVSTYMRSCLMLERQGSKPASSVYGDNKKTHTECTSERLSATRTESRSS